MTAQINQLPPYLTNTFTTRCPFASDRTLACAGVSLRLTCPYQLYSNIVTTTAALVGKKKVPSYTSLLLTLTDNKINNDSNSSPLLSSLHSFRTVSFACVESLLCWGEGRGGQAKAKLLHTSFAHLGRHAYAHTSDSPVEF